MNILEWIRKKGFEYTWNVKLGGKFPDIIAFNKEEIIAFEIKKRADEISSALGQCLFYLKVANKAFIVLPVKESSKVKLDVLKKHGIGLVGVNEDVKVILEPKSFGPSNKKFMEKLKEKSLVDIGLNNSGEKIKQKILETLRKHPEGLTIQDLSRSLKLHRQTITKYVLVLKARGIIHRRRVGSATLHYVKEQFVESVKERAILEKMRKRLEK